MCVQALFKIPHSLIKKKRCFNQITLNFKSKKQRRGIWIQNLYIFPMKTKTKIFKEILTWDVYIERIKDIINSNLP